MRRPSDSWDQEDGREVRAACRPGLEHFVRPYVGKEPHTSSAVVKSHTKWVASLGCAGGTNRFREMTPGSGR
jgi:hypothetical protein